MMEALKELVEYESPSTEKVLPDELRRRLQECFRKVGAEVTVLLIRTYETKDI